MSKESKHENPDIEQEMPDTEENTSENQNNAETDLEDAAENAGDKKEELNKSPKSEQELWQEKLDNMNDQLMRTMAEYDNFRRRSQREKDAIYPKAISKTVEQFVPIVDTFERALAVECADAEFKKGIEMILQNFKDVLQKLGVEEFGEVGDLFDPEKHNAVMHIEDEQHEANSIAAVFQKGYQLGDRIIRHAMVQVVN